MADNFVDDTYYYLLTVYTGMRNGAGTRSRIGFILSGSDGDTGIRELYDGVRRVNTLLSNLFTIQQNNIFQYFKHYIFNSILFILFK